MISFDVSLEEFRTIQKITDRAVRLAGKRGREIDRTKMSMDLTACHANGCPLRLADLLAADDFNFAHDVFGIGIHMDRQTGKLADCFLPRFADVSGEEA